MNFLKKRQTSSKSNSTKTTISVFSFSNKSNKSSSSFMKFLKFRKKDPKIISKNSLNNITINITDIFGIGILFTTISTLLNKHFEFLSQQPNFIRWFIIIWEMIIISLCILYFGKILDVISIIIRLADDGIRIIISILSLPFKITFNL
ncbi:hypothetical protein RhiirA5_411888 [Rhizophagus irregularis]|uniref:Uncharacterized protein n=1 Tax=Rhizophagus irregularis TaxID=588596 RepID=A0A2N0Q028_9GLOM|nr:hypothetical protein RhiirA5_411888 [Rhizophagus irregularis]